MNSSIIFRVGKRGTLSEIPSLLFSTYLLCTIVDSSSAVCALDTAQRLDRQLGGEPL